jgi:hypothetical protein
MWKAVAWAAFGVVGISGLACSGRFMQYAMERHGRLHTPEGEILDHDLRVKANIALSNKYPIMHMLGDQIWGPIVQPQGQALLNPPTIPV